VKLFDTENLNHSGQSAWYRPLTFTSNLPVKISEIEDDDFESRLVVAHENLHYVQSISTISCIRPFFTYWQCHAGLSDFLRSKNDREAKLQTLRDYYQQFTKEMDHWNGVPELEASDEIDTGPLLAKVGDGETIPVFSQNNTKRGNKFICYTRTAVQESMALAYEIWLGRDPSVLNTALRSGHWQYMQYAIGIAGLHRLTLWDDIKSLSWVTMVCADYALDHAFPGTIFVEAIHQVARNWKTPPALSEIKDIYELLSSTYDHNGRSIVREECAGFLNDFRSKAEAEPTQFDAAIHTLFDSMAYAMKVRERKPHLIVKALLRHPNSTWFLENFQMPMYLSDTSVIQSGVGFEKFRASLMMEVGFHRLKNLMEPNSSQSVCPYFEFATCKFDRSAICEAAPWVHDRRNTNDGNVCVYEYVEQAYHFFD